MQNTKQLIKDHWMPIAFLLFIMVVILLLEFRRRKKAALNETPFFRDSFLFYPMEYMLTPDNRVEDLSDFNNGSEKNESNKQNREQYIISPEVESAATKNQNVNETLSKFKSLFENGEICSMDKLIQKGNENKILIMGSNVMHTMEFNPRRVIVDVMMDRCVGPGCHTWFTVKSIG